MRAAKLLDAVCARLRTGAPETPANVTHRIVAVSRPRGFAQIWFRTRGCRYRVGSGGCAVCDYGGSEGVTPATVVHAVAEGLSALPFQPRTLVLSASGSFLDPWEVPEQERDGILRLVARRLPHTYVLLETHAAAVTDEVIRHSATALGTRSFGIELGLECSDPALLRLCLNKNLTPGVFQRAVSVVSSLEGPGVTANVLLGIPFLSPTESAGQALATIEWAFGNGVDRCVLFPLNLRAHTLARWLVERSLWRQPSLWDLVDVLLRVPESLLNRVDIAWYAPIKWDASLTVLPVAPITCERCHGGVVGLLNQFYDGVDRGGVLAQLRRYSCPCRVHWATQREDPRPLRERALEGYEAATSALLGPEIWEQAKEQVATDLAELGASAPGGVLA